MHTVVVLRFVVYQLGVVLLPSSSTVIIADHYRRSMGCERKTKKTHTHTHTHTHTKKSIVKPSTQKTFSTCVTPTTLSKHALTKGSTLIETWKREKGKKKKKQLDRTRELVFVLPGSLSRHLKLAFWVTENGRRSVHKQEKNESNTWTLHSRSTRYEQARAVNRRRVTHSWMFGNLRETIPRDRWCRPEHVPHGISAASVCSCFQRKRKAMAINILVSWTPRGRLARRN